MSCSNRIALRRRLRPLGRAWTHEILVATRFSPCLRSRLSSPLRNSSKGSSSRRKTSPISLPNPSPLNLLLERALAPLPARPEASAGNVRPPSPIFWPAERFQRSAGLFHGLFRRLVMHSLRGRHPAGVPCWAAGGRAGAKSAALSFVFPPSPNRVDLDSRTPDLVLRTKPDRRRRPSVQLTHRRNRHTQTDEIIRHRRLVAHDRNNHAVLRHKRSCHNRIGGAFIDFATRRGPMTSKIIPPVAGSAVRSMSPAAAPPGSQVTTNAIRSASRSASSTCSPPALVKRSRVSPPTKAPHRHPRSTASPELERRPGKRQPPSSNCLLAGYGIKSPPGRLPPAMGRFPRTARTALS